MEKIMKPKQTTKMKTVFKTTGYYKPTPKIYRKLGDALLACSTLITTYAIADEWSKYVALAALLLGVAGKFLTNFFTDETTL